MIKQLDFISGIFWLVIGLGLTIWTLVSYEIGSLTKPGPGFLPFALGCLLLLLSLILVFNQLKKTPGARQAGSLFNDSKGWKRVAYAVVVVLVAAFVFESVGYLLTFFFMIVLLMKGVTHLGLKSIFITALLATIGVHVVFLRLLNLQLPLGFLGV